MRISAVAGLGLLLSACSLAPAYKVPETPEPAAYKETGPWVPAGAEDTLPRTAWWELYSDATLSGLEGRIEGANPTLAQAVARYNAARGYLAEAQSNLLPTVDIGGHADEDKQSANRPLRSASQPIYYGDDRLAAASLSWDLDLWGRVRNEVAAGKYEAQSSFADLAALRLRFTGVRLANDYEQLPGDLMPRPGCWASYHRYLWQRRLALTQ